MGSLFFKNALVAFLFLAAVFLPYQNVFAAKHLIMKVVAEVDQKPLSSRDVELHYFVSQILEGRVPKLPLTIDSDEFRLSLDQLVVETMVYNEALDFGIAKVGLDEVDAAAKTVKQKISESPQLKTRWNTLDYSDIQLKEKLERRLRAAKLLKYKTDSSNQQVTDGEAKDYFEKNKQRFGSVTFDNFKPTIKKFIAKKNAEERLREWFDVLKKKYRVRNLI